LNYGILGAAKMKVTQFTALFFCLVFALSCQPRRPSNVLSRDALAAVLIDLYLAESRVNLQGLPGDSGYKYFVPFEDSLFKKRALNDSLLRHTYQYYLSHPEELEQVYAAVVDSLNLRLQKAAGASGTP
jgi:hypothetical protein